MKNKSSKTRYRVDLPAHMAECDANYLRLQKLLPGLVTEAEAVSVFRIPFGDADARVSIAVETKSPYTSVVRIVVTSLPPELETKLGPTTIRIRVYHDAKSAEVIEFQNQRRFQAIYDYPNAKMRQRNEKAQINRFLSEFLAQCLNHGVAMDEFLALS